MGINDLKEITKDFIRENDCISMYSRRTKMTYKLTLKELTEYIIAEYNKLTKEVKPVKEVEQKEKVKVTAPASKKVKAKVKE